MGFHLGYQLEKIRQRCVMDEMRGCWRILILGCSPQSYFRPCIRQNAFAILLTRWSLQQRSTTVSFLRSNTTTLHTWCDTIKHRSPDDETQTTVNSWTSTIPAAINSIRGIRHNCTFGQEALPWKCYRKSKQKEGLEMESWTRIRHAQDVFRGWRFSVDKDHDIRQPVLPFVCLSSSSHTYHIFLSRFYGHHLSCQSHSFLHTISFLFIVLWYLLSIITVRINKSFVPFGNLGLDPLRLTTQWLFKSSDATV